MRLAPGAFRVKMPGSQWRLTYLASSEDDALRHAMITTQYGADVLEVVWPALPDGDGFYSLPDIVVDIAEVREAPPYKI